MIASNSLSLIRRLRIPARYHIVRTMSGLKIKCLQMLEREVSVELEPYRSRGSTCRRVIARTDLGERLILELASFNDAYETDISGVVRARRAIASGDLLTLESASYREESLSIERAGRVYENVRNSWTAGIRYISEIVDEEGQVLRTGLRKPQIGALHAVAAHWTLSDESATIVMPTGTGKTEVMIATAIDSFCRRLLIIVPTDALRQQTADKFEVYGILKQIGIIDTMPYPLIGLLLSKPTPEQFDHIKTCNVVVSTMSSIGLAEEYVQRDFARLFSHIFFDEAHHIEAVTWKRFQRHCHDAKTLLLTATPFREDGKSLEGKIIYSYPLSAAQEEGYFRPINFIEVFEPDERYADHSIAEAAVERLREDLAQGYNHLLMARAQTINDAKILYEKIYSQEYREYDPILIHSQTSNKRSVLEAIRSGRHKIIVCVDMFGEGFDLPNLKVAALHSIHKSLGITLQFIGRFARNAYNVGAATFVANTAEDGVPEALESLYQEDADWNLLLADLSYDAIEPQTRLSELVNNLESLRTVEDDVKISTLALRPKISARVYRTNSYHPEGYPGAFRPSQRVIQPQISRRDNMLVLITNQKEHIDWTDSKDIVIDSWDLYIAYFDPINGLLYIHSSRKGDSTGQLARSISQDPVLIRDEEIFKAYGGLRRLTLYSVGLTSRSRNVRYQMYAGLDVRNAIDPVQQHSKLKSNITGVGYEEGRRQSVGCSRKGKIWSMRSGSLAEWRSWCDMIGSKLCNPELHSDDFLKYTLIPKSVTSLPLSQAIMADWPDQLFESFNFKFEVYSQTENYEFDNCQIDLEEWNPGGNSFLFRLRAGIEHYAIMRLTLTEADGGEETYVVDLVSGENLEIDAAGQRRMILDFFNENPPLIRLEDGAQLSGNILLQPQEQMADTYNRDQIQELDWSGIDITQESRWSGGRIRRDTVQHRLIEHLEDGSATFIIDDDDTGESADVVAIEETDNRIIVYLWHCKYSSGEDPGHRVADLYEVCGQAQKSVKWTSNLRTLIKHLIRRETNHKRGRDSRFIRGSITELATLQKSSRRKYVDYKIGIVQPGLLKSDIPVDHLAIIGSTSSFIQCITDSPLLIIASA